MQDASDASAKPIANGTINYFLAILVVFVNMVATTAGAITITAADTGMGSQTLEGESEEVLLLKSVPS